MSCQLPHNSGLLCHEMQCTSPTYKGMHLLVACVSINLKMQEAHLHGTRCGCRWPNCYGVHEHKRLRCRTAQVLSNPAPQLRTGRPQPQQQAMHEFGIQCVDTHNRGPEHCQTLEYVAH